jgi:CheY-like chemotaxis protein
VTPGILLVEDDADIRQTIGEVLEEEGYLVTTASDGREALEKLESGPLPHLIVLDLMMPGMDGVQFRAEQIKRRACAAIPLLVLSADTHTHELARDLGAECLRKPVDLADLLAAVQRSVRDVTRRGRR